MTRSTKRLKKAVSMPCQLVRYPAIRPATYPPIRYEMKIPMTTGTAGALSCTTLASPSPGGRLGERCLCPRGLRERIGEVGLLPRQLRPAEVTVRGRLPIDRTTKPEPLDDGAWPEVDVLADELANRFVGDRSSTECLNI